MNKSTLNAKFLVAICWSVMASFISAMNDTLGKFSGGSLGGINVLFFRFLFSTLILLPFVWAAPRKFATKHLSIHAIRGGLFALAMLPWCYGLIQLPLPVVTTISFTTPLFVVILAATVLKERVGWARFGATLVGFGGVVLSVGASCNGLNTFAALALLATFAFATLDIINKRLLVLHEDMKPMIFFSSLWTTLFVFPLALWHWKTPPLQEIGLLFLLGIGANGFLWCLLKASQNYDLSALQPLRYTEFIFSCFFSAWVFQQSVTIQMLLGLFLIIPATLYLGYHELHLESLPAQCDAKSSA